MTSKNSFPVLFVILLLSLSSVLSISAQTKPDVAKKDSIEIKTLKTKVDSLSSKIAVIQKSLAEPKKIECTKQLTKDDVGLWFIIFFMPIVVLIFALIFFIVFYRSKEFKIAQLIGFTIPNQEENKKNKDIVGQSTSRFIALMTGLTAIFVATTLVMYYGYMMVAQCNNSFDLDGLWKILAGLGIGIIPYGINVWNKNNKEETVTKPPTTNPPTGNNTTNNSNT